MDNVDAEKTAIEMVNTFVKRSGAYVIGLEYCKDIEGIFKKYFKQEFPFSEKKQKESITGSPERRGENDY